MPLASTENTACRYKASFTTGAWRNSGTSAKVFMKLYGTESNSEVIELTRNNDGNKPFSRGNTDNFLLAVGRPLGSLVKLHVGHDSSGEDPSWFLNEISITDIEKYSRWKFPCYRWLALEREDGSTTVELYAPNVNKRHGFKSEFNSARICGLANDHLWFSVVTKDPQDFFTRVQRVTCCFFFFLWGMLSSAMFYNIGNANETPAIQVGPLKMTGRELSVSIFTAIITFPPSFLVVFIFRNSRRSVVANDEFDFNVNEGSKRFRLCPFCIYIAWFVCIVGSLVAALIVIFYSLTWGGETSSRWLVSIFLTTTEDVFVSQPVKIVFICVLLALRLTSSRKEPVEQHDDSSEAPSLDSDSSQTLFNMSKEKIESQRMYRVTERKTNTFARDMVFSCVFLILLMIVCYGHRNEHRYRMAKATNDGFSKLHKVRKAATRT